MVISNSREQDTVNDFSNSREQDTVNDFSNSREQDTVNGYQSLITESMRKINCECLSVIPESILLLSCYK